MQPQFLQVSFAYFIRANIAHIRCGDRVSSAHCHRSLANAQSDPRTSAPIAYHRPMFSRRFIRWFTVALAFAWLPMSAFAQLCATHSIAMKVGGTNHPAMPHSKAEFESAGFQQAHVHDDAPMMMIVVDAETFWHSVDIFEDSCQAKAVCAFANAAVPPLAPRSINFVADAVFGSHAFLFPRSRVSVPDTPPPRLYS
jgi:hypothetical protein